MKFKKYLLFILAAVLAAGCSDDNKRLSPSELDDDWFRIEDSQDPVDHMRYEIYKEYGVSVFYNDTLGSRSRGVDGYGDDIIYYEMLKPFYSVGSQETNTAYTLSEIRSNIGDGVRVVGQKIIPALPEVLYPRSFLLVDELILNVNNTVEQGKREGTVYQGLRTTIVSRIGKLSGMGEAELDTYVDEVLAAIWYGHAVRNYSGQLGIFYAVSEGEWEPNPPSQVSVYFQMVSNSVQPGQPYNYRPHWTQFGFLISSPSMPSDLMPTVDPMVFTRYRTPSKEEDAVSFFNAVLTMPEAEFRSRYGELEGFDLLIRKFGMIANIVNSVRNNE